MKSDENPIKHILIGIQPTGRLHLGHYIGVIKPALKYKETSNVEFLMADYHSLTSVSKGTCYENCSDLRQELFEKFGFENIGYQEMKTLKLFWELIAQEPIGNLKHLPQFKSKEQTLGMLTYPVLMAADIIISNCTHVLVGEDQEPHMEYYRYIARKNGYKNIAKSIVVKDSKVMSIKDPTKKMSKSLGDDHCIYLDDSLEVIKAKLAKAPTTPEGLANLKKIAKAFSFKYNDKSNKESKEKLAEAICEQLATNQPK